MEGGAGDEQYEFDFSGTDTIIETSGAADLIYFTNEVFANIFVRQSGDDLVFESSNYTTKLTVDNFFLGGGNKVELLFDSTLSGIDISGWA